MSKKTLLITHALIFNLDIQLLYYFIKALITSFSYIISI